MGDAFGTSGYQRGLEVAGAMAFTRRRHSGSMNGQKGRGGKKSIFSNINRF